MLQIRCDIKLIITFGEVAEISAFFFYSVNSGPAKETGLCAFFLNSPSSFIFMSFLSLNPTVWHWYHFLLLLFSNKVEVCICIVYSIYLMLTSCRGGFSLRAIHDLATIFLLFPLSPTTIFLTHSVIKIQLNCAPLSYKTDRKLNSHVSPDVLNF